MGDIGISQESCWDLQSRNHIIRNALNHLHNRTDGVAMCSHEYRLAGLVPSAPFVQRQNNNKRRRDKLDWLNESNY